MSVKAILSGQQIPLAPEFNTSTTYGFGDYVVYENQTYRFKSPHAAGAWNNQHVDAIYPVGQYVTAGKKSGTTLGPQATAEGVGTTASGPFSHAEGVGTIASGDRSHAEGAGTEARGETSHAEGVDTKAIGVGSHAEGFDTEARGQNSHVEGEYTVATKDMQHVFGCFNIEDENEGKSFLEIVGNGDQGRGPSNARTLDWSGNEQLQGNLYVGADTSTPTLDDTKRVVTKSELDNKADMIVLAPAFSTSAAYGIGDYVTYDGKVYGCTTAHSAGAWNSDHFTEVKAIGQYVTAGKLSGTTLGLYATAEGYDATASGGCSHAEGYGTTASEDCSHAEGRNTKAFGLQSHAEGVSTTASGQGSHAEGIQTTANHKSQHTFGEYNVLDTNTAAATARGDYVEIVGNGTGSSARSNARTLDWSGNEVLAGTITIGGTNGITLSVDSNGNLKVTKGNKTATITLS